MQLGERQLFFFGQITIEIKDGKGAEAIRGFCHVAQGEYGHITTKNSVR